MSEERLAGTAYLDANVFIDFVEGEPALSDPLRPLFKSLHGLHRVVVTSELTLAEVLAPHGRTQTRAIAKDVYLDLIARNDAIAMVPVTRDVLLDTPDLRRQTGQKLIDAIHCATAVRAGCVFAMSRDRRMRRALTGLQWLNSDQTGVRTLLEAFGG